MGEKFTIEMSESDGRGRFALRAREGGKGELTFSRASETLVLADHTFVEPSLRGQGAARALFDALVDWARETETKVQPLCSYVVSAFQKDPESRDVMAK